MTAHRPAMKEQMWPADGLEHVPDCPVCGSTSRTLIHEGLSDRVFFVAPGQWQLWRCARCRSAWLDPRPTKETIGSAYREYYTHQEAERSTPGTAFQRLRAALGNGYRNSRYGTRLRPALPAGALVAKFLPPLRWPVDSAYRFLPRRRTEKPLRVLDIGCSNGGWLQTARTGGWDVAGAEPDPISRAQARDRGIEVRETWSDWLDEPETFDHVTISHVIEHVHDPLALLRDSYRLLKPGGGLFIDTPNIDAIGHHIYGSDWIGLDPPRHLILFTRESLASAVAQAGFEQIRFRPQVDVFRKTSAQSRQIAAGLDPFSDQSSAEMPPRPRLRQFLRASLARRNAEFLTLTAIKPR